MKMRLHFLFALCLSLLALFGSQLIGFSPAQATSVSSDPLVVVAVDVTAQSRCTLTKTVNVRSPHEFTVHHPCMGGTIIMSKDVPLSQAIAAHKRYVQLPSSGANQMVWEQTNRAIENLMRSEGITIRKQAGKETSSIPQIGCGDSTTLGLTWSADGDKLGSWVKYFKYSNCNTIAIDSSGVDGYTSSNALWWDHDQYASGWWGTGCPYIGTNTLYHNINSSQPVGYYFEPWVKNNQCIWDVGTFWDQNIGPLD